MKGPNRHMRTEQQALKVSLAAILLVSVLGIGFGLVSGSFAILFDGVFSLMDAVMSVVSLTVAGLISRSVANR
ncbi:cation transporter, partial [Burkholderia multivorans]